MLPRYRDVIKKLTPDDFYDDLSETPSEGQLWMDWFIHHGVPPHTAHDDTIAYLKVLFNSRLLAHLITSVSHIALISIHWTSSYGKLQKQAVFADKPTNLDDIKQNEAQYIYLSSMYRLSLWEKLDKTLESR